MHLTNFEDIHAGSRASRPTRRAFLAGAAGLAALGLGKPAIAQGWQQRPISLVVPFAAGGNTDIIARLAAQWLSDRLGRTFVVENRVGAAGAIAAEYVARAAPDGHTLFMAALPQIAIVPAMSKTKYDPVKDFAPISVVGTNPFVLAINKDLPAKSVSEFIAYVKAQKEQPSYSSAGIGSLNHLSMALFLKYAGVEMLHVPFRGNAPALQAVIAGHVPAMFTNLADALPQAQGGTIRLIGVSSEKRAAQIPDVPTVAESGYPQFKTLTWNGLMAPAGTPKELINQVADQIGQAVKDAKFVEKLASNGVDPLGNTPDAFAEMIRADIALWTEAVNIAGVKES